MTGFLYLNPKPYINLNQVPYYSQPAKVKSAKAAAASQAVPRRLRQGMYLDMCIHTYIHTYMHTYVY